MSEKKRYGFEQIIGSDTKDYGVEGFYQTFLKNLNLDVVLLNQDAEAILKRYVANVQVNADWYNKKLLGEKALQCLFFFFSVALLLLLPVCIYNAPTIFTDSSVWSAKNKVSAPELTALLTAVLGGFFAAHRAVSAWLNQRKLIGPYWQARSELLNGLYELETEWGPKKEDDKVTNSALSKNFSAAIFASLESARTAIQNERSQFYINYTFPDIDLSSSLSTAGTDALSITSMFEPAHLKKQRALAETRQSHLLKYQELVADVGGLAALLGQLKIDLGVKKTELGKETDLGKQKMLEIEVSAMISEIAKLTTQKQLKIQQRAQERIRSGLG